MNNLRTLRALLGDGPLDYRVTIKGRPVRLQNRGPKAHMGRFGGGWERNLGVQMGHRGLRGTIIINLWRGSIRINPTPVTKGDAR